MSPNPPSPNMPPEGYPYPPQPAGPASDSYAPKPYNASTAQDTGPQGPYPYPPSGAPGTLPPSGYPPSHAPPIQPYPPQQYVTGYPAGHAAGPGGMQVAAAAGPPPQDTRRCGCSAGWVLFGIGFIFPISWMVAAFLPLCTKNRFDRLAAMASSVFLLIYAVVVLATSLTMTNRGRSGYYSSNYYG